MLNELLIVIGFIILLFFIVEILPDILSKLFEKDHVDVLTALKYRDSFLN